MDLFDAIAPTAQTVGVRDPGQAISPNAPLAVRMRPVSLAELAGQQHLLAPGSPLRRLVEPPSGQTERAVIGSVILWGPPGPEKRRWLI